MILSFAVLSALTIIQTPREWLRHKPTRILFIIFHTIGITSLVLILIAGDVCDSASSVADLEYMKETLKKLSCPYGVYYAEGNHEVECRTDPEPYLLRAGITILCDRTLDESEKTDLVTLKYHTVHFSYIPKEWCGEMCARLPLPLPPEIKEKYVG